MAEYSGLGAAWGYRRGNSEEAISCHFLLWPILDRRNMEQEAEEFQDVNHQ
jgi:hypothetical protein